MPLVLDPDRYRDALLAELAGEFSEALVDMRTGLTHLTGRVLDPASIETARELMDAALARMGEGGHRTRTELAADANLGYATMVAVVDLVKSHTDVPRVPAPPKGRGGP